MRKAFGFLFLVTTCSVQAASLGFNDLEGAWYGSVGAGMNAMRTNDWDTPIENNHNIASRGFYTFEIGKQVQHYVDVSLMYLNHETFNYQMYHQSIANSGKISHPKSSPTVNLNNRALLVSGFLHPDNDWYKISTVSLSPFIGGGVGYALNQIDNFYSSKTNPTKSGLNSNPSVAVNSFAWQASAGLSIHPLDHLSLDVGYRYYDGGVFDTTNPAFTNTQPSHSLSLTNPWAGHVFNNQLFFDFKYKM